MPTKEEWVLIALALAEGKDLSPVQLQKSVFLLGKLLPEDVIPEDFYRFTPYNYGPFCSDIYDDAKDLEEEGLVTIEQPSFVKYSYYSATDEGIERGRNLANALPFDVSDHAQRLIEWVRKQSFPVLVSAIYERFPEYKVNSVFRG